MFQNVDGEWSQRGRVGDDMNLMLKVSIRHQWIMDTWWCSEHRFYLARVESNQHRLSCWYQSHKHVEQGYCRWSSCTFCSLFFRIDKHFHTLPTFLRLSMTLNLNLNLLSGISSEEFSKFKLMVSLAALHLSWQTNNTSQPSEHWNWMLIYHPMTVWSTAVGCCYCCNQFINGQYYDDAGVWEGGGANEWVQRSSQDKKFKDNKSSGKATSSKKKKQVTISVEFK